jgi:HAD superfamily hydrolase (TIGR01509 family)
LNDVLKSQKNTPLAIDPSNITRYPSPPLRCRRYAHPLLSLLAFLFPSCPRLLSNDTQITTLLLDCDNTLVLSEHLAFAACADLANTILAKHNISNAPTYTGEALMTEFVGQNFRGMLLNLCKKYDLTLSDEELAKYVAAEEDAVIGKLKESLEPCVGVMDALAKVNGKYELAVVSSSALRRLNASLVKTAMADYFGARVFSAATSLPEPTSKPDPAIYNFAVKTLGKKPEECLAVEDSKSGTLSGVRAGLRVMGYVGSYPAEEQEKMETVLKENGAEIVMKDWADFDKCVQQLDGAKL